MRAVVLRAFNEPLELEEREIPVARNAAERPARPRMRRLPLGPARGRELLRVRAPARARARDRGRGRPARQRARLRPVGLRGVPLLPRDEENVCPDAREAGLFQDGGYAEYIRVPARRYLYPIGDLDPMQAAPLGCGGLTPYRSVKQRARGWRRFARARARRRRARAVRHPVPAADDRRRGRCRRPLGAKRERALELGAARPPLPKSWTAPTARCWTSSAQTIRSRMPPGSSTGRASRSSSDCTGEDPVRARRGTARGALPVQHLGLPGRARGADRARPARAARVHDRHPAARAGSASARADPLRRGPRAVSFSRHDSVFRDRRAMDSRVDSDDVRDRRRTAAEVVDEALDRIAGANGALNAFCQVRPQAARAAAAAVDARVAAGTDPGPLAGVPLAVKDVIWEAGVEATDGSRSLVGFVPGESATVVRRLVDAGAVVVGRTNVPEFCYRGFCVNDLYGATSNPWDLGRTTGGSSGGSAAAVAAGLVPLAIGTDGGGSIRIPSSFCGVTGIKPTYGVVPREPQWPGWLTLTHLGPIAFTVEDCALMLSVMAGPDGRDPMSLPRLDGDLLAGARIVATSPGCGWVSRRTSVMCGSTTACAPRSVRLSNASHRSAPSSWPRPRASQPARHLEHPHDGRQPRVRGAAARDGPRRARHSRSDRARRRGLGRRICADAQRTVGVRVRLGPVDERLRPVADSDDGVRRVRARTHRPGDGRWAADRRVLRRLLSLLLPVQSDRPAGDQRSDGHRRTRAARWAADRWSAVRRRPRARGGAAWERLGAWPRAPREQRAPLDSEAQAIAAGVRIAAEGEVAEIRRVLSPRDGERVVEYEPDPRA